MTQFDERRRQWNAELSGIAAQRGNIAEAMTLAAKASGREVEATTWRTELATALKAAWPAWIMLAAVAFAVLTGGCTCGRSADIIYGSTSGPEPLINQSNIATTTIATTQDDDLLISLDASQWWGAGLEPMPNEDGTKLYMDRCGVAVWIASGKGDEMRGDLCAYVAMDGEMRSVTIAKWADMKPVKGE